MGMADCKACGAWFSSTAPSELCPTCERALKRLNGYAVSVMRCNGCKNFVPFVEPYQKAGQCRKMIGLVSEDDFCSYGERRERENESVASKQER